MTAKNQLFNSLVAVMRKKDIGFTSQQAEKLGNHVVSTLTDNIWFLDPHVEKFLKRGIKFPEMFREMFGCRDLKAQHKKKNTTGKIISIFMPPAERSIGGI